MNSEAQQGLLIPEAFGGLIYESTCRMNAEFAFADS